MISIGKGFFEFPFSSVEDLRKLLVGESWDLKPKVLWLLSWSPNFNPNIVLNLNA
uniref:DUF4283 domain-containing protein n=1 Tax=Cajanus cajan TaxID=3821 RepID=A0A151RDZ9_CAJCA|nr:hypothetical protein KK1_038047 [Cajanus cajan]